MRGPALAVAAGGVEAAIGRLERHHRHAARRQWRHPGAVRAQPRPAGAAQRQQHRAGAHPARAGGRVEQQCPVRVPARPAVTHVKAHRHARRRGVAQPLQPGAQQRRGLHVGGKHAPGGAHERRHAQPFGPGAQGVGAKLANQRLDGGAARPIAPGKGIERLGVRQVQPTLARQQKLAPHRRHGVEQVHGAACRREHFRRRQPGRAGADEGDVERRVSGDGSGHAGIVAAGP